MSHATKSYHLNRPLDGHHQDRHKREFRYSNMTEKWSAGTNTKCPSYRGVRLIEVSVKSELTVNSIWRGEGTMGTKISALPVYEASQLIISYLRWTRS